MLKNKNIAIIIPTFEPQEYFWGCLASVDEQKTTFDLRVIIVLNGPKEPHFSSIEKYLHAHGLKNSFELFYLSEFGVSNARNFGLNAASSSDYYVFLDDDDSLSENFIDNCMKKMVGNPLVISNFMAFKDQEGRDNSFYDHIGFHYANLKKKKAFNLLQFAPFFSTVTGKMFPSSMIGLKRFDSRFHKGEDALFMLSISNNIDKIVFAESDTIYYRRIRSQSASRITGNYFRQLNNDLFLVVAHINLILNHSNGRNKLLLVAKFVRSILNLLTSFFGKTQRLRLPWFKK